MSAALKLDGRVIKTHPTREQCAVEAFERGLVVTWRSGTQVALVDGAEIVDVADNDNPMEEYAAAWNAADTDRFGDWMQTFKGAPFWPLDPRVEEIDVEDIAHALSMLCRYNGHCLHFYSVAEHSVHVSRHVAPENALWALLHDAGEAYLADVPRPVKPFLPGYKEAEARVQAAVAERFGLPAQIPADVHDADNRILGDEMRQNMAYPQREWSISPHPLGIQLKFWEPWKAEQEFLKRFRDLTAEPMARAA